MDAVFQKLLTLSFQAGIIALVVTVLRVFLRKAPKKLICSLWLLVALRLLVPFSLESRISLMRYPEMPEILTEEKGSEVPSAPVPNPDSSKSVPELVRPMESPLPDPMVTTPSVEPEQKPSVDVLIVLEIIWSAGVLGMVLYGGISYGRLRHKVNPALEVRKGIYFCDYIESPFVMGTLRPRIYLPSTIQQRDIPYILAHERAHIARLDPLWKQIGFFLLTIHWFNPLLWLAFILFCRDIESACDEKVIARMGDSTKVPYSNALLNCSLPKGRIYPLAFGEIGVRQRIKEVLNYRKPALWITVTAVLALVLTGVCLLTTPPDPLLTDLFYFSQEETIHITSDQYLYSMETSEEIQAAEEFLKSVHYDPEPLETSFDPMGYETAAISVGPPQIPSGLFFSLDGGTVSLVEEGRTIQSFSIQQPQTVLDFFSIWMKPMQELPLSGITHENQSDPWAYDLSITAVTQTGCTLNISGNNEIIGSDRFWLYAYENGQFFPLPEFSHRPDLTDFQLSQTPKNLTLDWQNLYGILPAGKYRLMTILSHDGETLEATSDFAVSEESIPLVTEEVMVRYCYSQLYNLAALNSLHYLAIYPGDRTAEVWFDNGSFIRELVHDPQYQGRQPDNFYADRYESFAVLNQVSYRPQYLDPKDITSPIIGWKVNGVHTKEQFSGIQDEDAFRALQYDQMTIPRESVEKSSEGISFQMETSQDYPGASDSRKIVWKFNQDGTLESVCRYFDPADADRALENYYEMRILNTPSEEIRTCIWSLKIHSLAEPFSWAQDQTSLQDIEPEIISEPIPDSPQAAAELFLRLFPSATDYPGPLEISREEKEQGWKVSCPEYQDGEYNDYKVLTVYFLEINGKLLLYKS